MKTHKSLTVDIFIMTQIRCSFTQLYGNSCNAFIINTQRMYAFGENGYSTYKKPEETL